MSPELPDHGDHYDGEYQPQEITAEHLARLDFSVFHPLDHRPWSRRCRAMHGGGRHHLALAWSFQWRPWWRGRLWCPLGFHEPATVTWSHGHVELRCANCDTPMSMVRRRRG